MISFITIVKNGQPFITQHLPTFEKLSLPWHWYVVEGTSGNTADQSWCQPQEPGLSTDGTTEYLHSLIDHPNVTVIQQSFFPSKTLMMNEATERITEPGLLFQVDSDEIHDTDTIERIAALFAIEPGLAMMRLPCTFYVGPDLVCRGENCWGAKEKEWLRVFRFKPGMSWAKHEPPVLTGCEGRTMPREEAARNGLSFQHYSYVTEGQVIQKESYYPYRGLLNQWRSLQANNYWPIELQRFFPWVDDKVMVDRIK